MQMFSLYYQLDDCVKIDKKEYPINVSFDNILKIIDMLNDKRLASNYKTHLGLQMFFGKRTDLIDLPLKTKTEIFNQVFNEYVNQEKKEEVQTDLAGNPLPAKYKKDKENFYSLKHDAEYIYASFLQAYGIDLIEQQGKLHWFKFQALLAGLPEDTKFRQVVSIRMWKKPSKHDTEEKQMLELQEVYKLPNESKVEEWQTEE